MGTYGNVLIGAGAVAALVILFLASPRWALLTGLVGGSAFALLSGAVA